MDDIQTLNAGEKKTVSRIYLVKSVKFGHMDMIERILESSLKPVQLN